MAIGYGRAKNLMKQFDWKMRATVMVGSVTKIELTTRSAPAPTRCAWTAAGSSWRSAVSSTARMT